MIIDKYPVLGTWESIPTWNRTSPRTDSDQAFKIAWGWIENCLSDRHKLCKSPQSPALPTRVVGVGLQDGVVKLIESKGAAGKYFCLSHCWGPDQIIMTTRANIQDHKREIPLNSLSKTFRDAVLLTRRFGIEYIWIDSLCIVQDDNNDWKVESAKMATIYCNAHLTMAATQSSNGTGGLYTATPDFEVSGVSSSGEKYSLFFREKIDHHIEYSNGTGKLPGQTDDREHSGRSTIARHPLLTRAWVFQERLLSTRVLHFGPHELFFECRTSIECECDGIAYWGSSAASPMAATKLLYADAIAHHKRRQRLPESFGYRQHWISRLWRTLVSSYTALKITRPHDRLPAIGGLAKSIQSEKASAYLAGLWQESLSEDLLWVIYSTSAHKSPRPWPRSGPTWSWASVDTSSLYFDEVLTWHPDIWIIENSNSKMGRIFKHMAGVVSCTVVQDGVDEFGVISRGILKLSGAVSEGILEREIEIHRGERCVVYYVSFPSVRLPMNPDYLLDHKGPDQVMPGMRVSCLRMSVVREGSRETLVSLVLRPAINSAVFERIGTLLINATPPPVDVDSGVFELARVRTVTIQ